MDLAHILFERSDSLFEFLSATKCLEELGVVVGAKLLNLLFSVVHFGEGSIDLFLDVFSADCVAPSTLEHLLQGVNHFTFHYFNNLYSD